MKQSVFCLTAIYILFIVYCLPLNVSAQAGNLDPTFSLDGMQFSSFGSGDDQAQSIVVQPDGKILVAGYTSTNSNYSLAILRYKADGSLDSTFSTDGKVTTSFFTEDDFGFDMALQSDGKIVVVGYTFHTSYNHDVFAIARYNTDGTLDNTFGNGGLATLSLGNIFQRAYGVAIQPDGKIVVVGTAQFNSSSADYQCLVGRFNTNGTLDLTFSSDGYTNFNLAGSGFDTNINDVAIQADGKILIGGSVQNAAGNNVCIVRLNTNGSFDNSFDDNGYLVTDFLYFDSALKIALQSDGKIVMCGSFDNKTGLVRYNTNGSIDSTFSDDGITTVNIGTAGNHARALAIQTDGRIVTAGISVNGTTNYCFTLARFLSDGSPDVSLNNVGWAQQCLTSTTMFATDIALQPDGKILITGTSGSSPSGTFLTMRFIGCSSSTTTYTDSNCLTYYWPESQATYNVSGNYSVTYPNAQGCDSIITLNLTIYQNPNVNVSQSGATLTAIQAGASYQWLDCNNNNDPITGATNQSYTATVNGSYRVQVTKNGCSDFSTCRNVTTVGVAEITNSAIKLLSNYNNTNYYLTSVPEGSAIMITDLSGRTLFCPVHRSSANAYLDVSPLSMGMYLVYVMQKDEILFSGKLIKQ